MKPTTSPGGDLRAKILRLMDSPKYQPLDKVELTKKLGLTADDRAALKELLRLMEQEGAVARIKKDRYVRPDAADLFPGVIHFNDKGYAFVISETPGMSDLFITAENTWVALHGDRVLARVNREGYVDAKDRRFRAPAAGQRREGRVIRILKRANETVVGTLQKSKQFYHVVADDPRFIHDIYVHPEQTTPTKRPEVGDKVVVRLENWEQRHVNPEGKIIEVLGPAAATGVDMLSIVRKFHLPEEFPRPVMQAARDIPEVVDEEESARREDLRQDFIITIDPDDARDFDDAVRVEELPGGGWRLGVHIADVSHYVPVGGVLDREAFDRGNSVYLADRVIPMLPERLSNGVCSLKPKVDRLTYSVFIDFGRAGGIKNVRFARTVICSAARLTYREAFALLNGPAKASPLAGALHRAWRLASLLRENRFKNGSLELDMPEVKVFLDKDGKPVRLEKIENDISHQLIEEFMLAANEVVARELKNRNVPTVYRVHGRPGRGSAAGVPGFCGELRLPGGGFVAADGVAKAAAGGAGAAGGRGDQAGVVKKLEAGRLRGDAVGSLRVGEGELHAFYQSHPAVRGPGGPPVAGAVDRRGKADAGERGGFERRRHAHFQHGAGRGGGRA